MAIKFAERADKSFSWLEHGKTLVDILLALGLGKIIGWLSGWAHVPAGEWRTAVWLLSAAVILWGILKIWPHPHGAIQAAPSQTALVTPKDTVDKYYNRFDPAFTAEVEALLRDTASSIPAGKEREAYLYRALTVGYLVNEFDSLWWAIFGSQIKVLHHLNNSSLKRKEVIPFYADAVKSYPERYVGYAFDEWVGWLRTRGVIREDGDLVSITIRGRDFLGYLIDEGRPVHQKIY